MLTTMNQPWLKEHYQPNNTTIQNRVLVELSNIQWKQQPTSLSTLRKNYLENISNSNPQPEPKEEDKPGHKKHKISFKIKNTTAACKRSTTLSANKVSQLTHKFNELVHDEPKIAKAVRRANSVADAKRKPSVKRKVSVKKTARKAEELEKREHATTGSVKATIEIFERRSSREEPGKEEQRKTVERKSSGKEQGKVKPRVPEKSGVRKGQFVQDEEATKRNLIELQDYFRTKMSNQELSINSAESNQDLLNDKINIPLHKTEPDQAKPSSKSSLYDSLKITKTQPPAQLLQVSIKPNNSFLWRSKSKESMCFNRCTTILYENVIDEKSSGTLYEDTGQLIKKSEDLKPKEEDLYYDPVDPKPFQPEDEDKHSYQKLLAKTDEILKVYKSPKILKLLPPKSASKELDNISIHSYESYYNNNYEEMEFPKTKPDSDYEILSLQSTTIVNQPLPSLPSESKHSNLKIPPNNSDSEDDLYATVKDCYETIPSENVVSVISDFRDEKFQCYESLYPYRRDDLSSSGSNRGSMISCDQQSNSLYGRCEWTSDVGGAASEVSSSDRSDDWIDVSDPEFEDNCKEEPGFVIIREKQRNKKNAGWSHKVRDQWTKSPKKHAVTTDDLSSDPYHYYESLQSDDDFDSFDSESEDESAARTNPNDSGVDMRHCHLPEPPGSDKIYGLTKLAASAGKHMKRLRRNWSSTKHDITRSLTRMTKKRGEEKVNKEPVSSPALPTKIYDFLKPKSPASVSTSTSPSSVSSTVTDTSPVDEEKPRSHTNSMSRKKNWLKFRRYSSMSEPVPSAPTVDEQSTNPIVNRSTFYLTREIDADTGLLDGTRHMSLVELQPKPPVPVKRKPRPLSTPRPQSPPPPTPTQKPSAVTKKDKARSTSWYAECGLFKNADLQLPVVIIPPAPASPGSNTCWYAEVGLYQQTNSTPSSSSAENSGHTEEYYNLKNGSSTVKDEELNGETLKKHASADMQLLLKDEPLYQFYDAAVVENACQENSSDSDYDGYEEIGTHNKVTEEEITIETSSPPTVTRTSVRTRISGRTLWCEIPEVVQSEIISTLTGSQRKLQEAKFEIITSEASYLNSLVVLEEHFIASLEKESVLDPKSKSLLFDNVNPVRECSEQLLSDLESCWQDNILLSGICDILLHHCTNNFNAYIRYCENQVHLDVTLKQCKERDGNFTETLRQLETSPACQSLSLYSFLMLPMQRVTRLPLLIDAVLKRLTPDDDEYDSCQKALVALNELVMRCNEGARKVERKVELERIASQLEYPAHMSPIDLPSSGHWLVRSGEVMQLISRSDDTKLSFGKKFSKLPLTLYLFDSILIVTRRKPDATYTVLHHCARNFIEPCNEATFKEQHGRHLLLLTLLENQEQKTVELVLSCPTETERQRWLEALSPPVSQNPNETVYESWDCPQVRAVHRYQASQPDELALVPGDVVNIDRKMADGWYHGERMRDGVSGWFPGNHTVEIANPHVRARNLKQRYRLLAFTGNYLNKR